MNGDRFFSLSSECILVKGILRGAIYDLRSGNVYSVNERSIGVLDKLSSGRSLEYVLKKNEDIIENELVGYLARLETLNLGKLSEHYVKEPIGTQRIPEMLRFVLHLELTTGCNLRCVHCYNESEMSKLYVDGISFDDWKRVIDEAYKMGCRRVQFIGGEPFLKRELMFGLIPHACNLGYTSIEISSNGTMVSESDLEFLKKHNINLALSFYSHRAQIHDLITAKKGSWARTLHTIKKALERGIRLRVSVVIMRQDQGDGGETIKFLKSLGVQNAKTAAIEPVGRGCNYGLIANDMLSRVILSKPSFSKITPHSFWRSTFGHNCFLEQICVISNGDIYPCLAEREMSYGNIKSASIDEIFSSVIAQEIRGLSKDCIEICRDCEYRYCCFDCRVRAKDSLTNTFHPKPWWCSYNPYKGQWENRETHLKEV